MHSLAGFLQINLMYTVHLHGNIVYTFMSYTYSILIVFAKQKEHRHSMNDKVGAEEKSHRCLGKYNHKLFAYTLQL